MSTNVIGIFGKTCTAKSDVARELSRLTGNKVKHPGEAVTTRAKVLKLASGKDVPDEAHREIDADTVAAVERLGELGELWIIESALLDAVLAGRDDVFWVRLESRDDVREARWHKRREEGGGRTRQIGESVAQRDADDAELRKRLYGLDAPALEPDLVIDSSERSAFECAGEVLAEFQRETGVTLSVAKTEMDKAEKRGIRPGPSSGVVRTYTPARPPFGGYITDDKSGKELYVHKSAIAEAGIDDLSVGQKLHYEVVEDGFGGFKASKLEAAP